MRNIVLPALVAMGVFVPEVKRDERREVVFPLSREERRAREVLIRKLAKDFRQSRGC